MPFRFDSARLTDWSRDLGRSGLALIVAGLVFAVSLLGSASAGAANLRLILGRPIDGTTAPLVLARNELRKDKIELAIEGGASANAAIQRVAQGTFDVGVVDLGALIQYRMTPDAVPVKAVFILYSEAPQAIIARRSRRIATFADLAGKKLGITDTGFTKAQWLALAKLNGIDPASIKIETISPAVRAPLLSAGQTDAISGLTFTTPIDLRDRGIPAADLIVFRMAEYGYNAPGDVVIVNPKFAAEHGDDLRALLEAIVSGIKMAARRPSQAIDKTLALMEAASRDTEIERLKAVLHENILTPEAKRNGLGTGDPDRIAAAIAFQENGAAKIKLTPEDIFDPSFLLPPTKRAIR